MVRMPLSRPLRRLLSCQQHSMLGPTADTIARSPAQDDMKAGTEERWLLAASGGPFTRPSYMICYQAASALPCCMIITVGAAYKSLLSGLTAALQSSDKLQAGASCQVQPQ